MFAYTVSFRVFAVRLATVCLIFRLFISQFVFFCCLSDPPPSPLSFPIYNL